MDLQALDSISTVHNDSKVFWRQARVFLESRDAYSLPPSEIRTTRFSHGQLAEMEGYKFAEVEGAVAGLDGFPRAEKENTRLRPLFAPDLNSCNTTGTGIQFPPKSTVDAHSVSCCEDFATIQFDFASYFDQFALSAEVQRLMAFKWGNRTMGLLRLPMGLRQSVLVAQAATWVLLDFDMGDVRADTTIDNVRFTGQREGVLTTARTFLLRCAAVRAHLNDIGVPGGLDECIERRLEVERGDFLGVTYNYRAVTKQNTEKTVRKLVVVRDAFLKATKMTRRQVAALFGVLFYATSVTRLGLAQRYNAIRYLRRLAAEQCWDGEAPHMCATVTLEIAEWLRDAIDNKPVPIVEPRRMKKTLTLITDASGDGWGAIGVRGVRVTYCSERWNAKERELSRSSVWAEPEAIFRAVCRFATKGDVVEVLTDHRPAPDAVAHGHAASWSLNTLCVRLERLRELCDCTLHHIAGIDNPADILSRAFGALPDAGRDAARKLAAVVREEARREDGRAPWMH